MCAVVGQMHLAFRGFRGIRTSFSPRNIRKSYRSMYARVPQAIAQFVLKIEKFVPSHGASPNSRISARLRSPFPNMAPATSKLSRTVFKGVII